MSGGQTEDDAEAARLDVWLWRARFFKTRSLSSTQIARRGVRITRNGQTRKTVKPGANIMAGDVVTFGRSVHIRTIRVVALGTRRGPAPEAALLYDEIEEEA